VGVSQSRGELGVPEDLFDHVQAGALFGQQRARGMPGVVQPRVLIDPGLSEQVLPLLPVRVGLDRPSVALAPHQIPPTVPGVPGGSPLSVTGRRAGHAATR
jgi:hypothetical protein